VLQDCAAFSGFSVDDLAAAEKFYGSVLGLTVTKSPPGLMLKLTGSNGVLIYPKPDHQPASYTMLNFPVKDIDLAVGALGEKGVKFEHYDGMTDDKGIARGLAQNRGPDIAWFKDPAGNILAVLQQS
jgi:catechol 2,3-dioxygenase-like lactoylglutathione lyase family enzyme